MAVNEMSTQPENNAQPTNGETQVKERPWFFAGLLTSGALVGESTESMASFRSTLPESGLNQTSNRAA